jgi:hypothetical protein
MAHEIIITNVAILKVYSSDPAPGNSNYVTFDKFKDQVEKCKTMLESCITNSTGVKTIKIYLGWGPTPFEAGDNTLGWAGGGTIAINQWNTGQYYLNDIGDHQNISVIIHEIFHVFGLFPSNISSNPLFTTKTDALYGTVRRVYTGANGLNGYKKVLLANNITVPDPLYICLEDDFGTGTVNVHLEEAYHSSVDEYEVIKIGEQIYPTLWNEIMSGLLDGDNYITPITMGCLEDFGYTINYDSQYIVTNGTNMKFVMDTKSKQMGTSLNYLTMNEDMYGITYLNKVLKNSTLKNRDILSETVIKKWGQKISR